VKIRVDCSTEHGEEAAQQLRWFLDGAEAGELDGDEMLSLVGKIADSVEAQRAAIKRVLGR